MPPVDVIDAITGRRSASRLIEPAPDDGELVRLVELAMAAPDHGMLRPWRLVLIRGGGRRRLGEALAECAGGEPEQRARAAAKPLRAPLLVGIVLDPTQGHKVAVWEQLAAASTMVYGLQLLLHAHGWGSIWRTGAVVDAPPVRRTLGLTEDERLLGWLYVGTADPAWRPAPRPAPDAYERVRVLHDDGSTAPLPAREPHPTHG